MNIQVCKSFSDATPLYLPQNLFLKPLSKLNVSIQLPSSKVLGKTISNWELMERMREIIKPDSFSSLKVVKSTSELLRFEGEIEDRKKLSSVVRCLDERSIKLSSYPESLKLKASEAKLDFPSRHTWDSYFRDTPNMDEMKPGERPDTIHISNLPIKWFISHRDQQDEDAKPSETIFRKVFEKFGKVRCVDIPICDPYRKQMKPHMTGMSTFTFDQELYFEGYVQFTEYMGFVKAMDAFRGMKLLKKGDNGIDHSVHITVDFDKTKHLSEATIKRRSIVRERLVARERAKEEKEKAEALKLQKKEENERRKHEQKEQENLKQMLEREERRKAKHLAQLKAKESTEITLKIAEEKKKLVRKQRKLQSIRLIEELFRRIQLKQKHGKLYDSEKSELLERNRDTKKELKKLEMALLNDRGRDNRERLVSKYKSAQEQEVEDQRQKFKKAVEGKLLLRSALDLDKKKARSPSISSVSSTSDFGEFDPRRVKTERPTSPERAMMIKTEDPMTRGYPGMPYGYPPYGPYMNNYYHPPVPTAPYYPRATYYPPPQEGGYAPRMRGHPNNRRPRGRGRGGARMPYFDGPNANHAYYMYFKKLTQNENEHDDRARSYSRSRSRSRKRSYSRSRSRSRSYTRSRSRSRRRSTSRYRSRYSRSRSRRSRTRSRSRSRGRSHSRHSRRSRSRSRRSKSKSRSRSRHRRSRSRSRRSRDSRSRNKSPTQANGDGRRRSRSDRDDKRKSKSVSKDRTNNTTSDSPVKLSDAANINGEGQDDGKSPPPRIRDRSKSWSLPKEDDKKRSWSKSPQRCVT